MTVARTSRAPQNGANNWQWMLRARRSLLLVTALAAAGFAGWIAAFSLAPQTSARGSRVVVDREVSQLLEQLKQGNLDGQERQQLLERLLLLGRYSEAVLVLRPWLEQQPGSLSLRLLMADLLRLTGDGAGAARELDQLLRLHPNNPEVLQLQVLVDLQQGRADAAVKRLSDQFSARAKGQRLELGLLLADLQRQGGQSETAAALYVQLAGEAPKDARPLLALAMLRQDQGRGQEVQTLLQEARQRRGRQGSDPLIDELASSWGLRAARLRAETPARPSDKP